MKYFLFCILLLSALIIRAQELTLGIPLGHTDDITTARFSPDGKKIITASKDGTAKIWDTETGKLLADLVGHTNGICSAEFSPDGKKVVTITSNYAIIIWDAETGFILKNFAKLNYVEISWTAETGWEKSVKQNILDDYYLEGEYSAIFSTDGKKIIIAPLHMYQSTIIFLDVETGKIIQDFHLEEPRLSPDWKRIADNNEYSIEIWNTETGKSVFDFKSHEEEDVLSLKFSPDGENIVIYSNNKTSIWNIDSRKKLFQLTEQIHSVEDIQFSPDGKNLLVASDDATMKVWDTESGILLRTLPIWLAQFSHNGKMIVSATKDSIVRIYDEASGKLLFDLIHTNAVNSAQFSPNGKRVLTVTKDKLLKLWNVQNGELIADFTGELESDPFSPDGEQILTVSSNIAKIWDTQNGKLLFELKGYTEKVYSAQFNPDGNEILTTSYNGLAKIWDANTGKMLYNLKGHTRIISPEFSPDGKYKVTTSNDTAKIWDAEKGEMIADLVHTDDVNSAYFSPDSKKVVTASSDNTVKVWDVESGNTLLKLRGHKSTVNTAQFSPDGKKILTASDDTKCKLWDASTGKELLTFMAIDSSDYIITTPSGLFDATPGAMEKMYWLKGDEVIEFAQLKDRYYEPGLWGKIMGSNTEPLREVKGLGEIKLSPAVILSISDNILNITLEDRGGGIGKYMIFINGKEVYTGNQTKDDIQFRGGTTLKSTFNLKDHSYLLPGVENEIEVKAYNGENYIVSRGEKIMYKQAGTLSSDQPRLFILTAGVSDYTGDQIDLKYAAKDAEDITLALTIGAKNLFGADKTFIYKMTTADTCKAHRPTKENIKKAFADISKEARSSDVIVVYLSGHGIDWGGQDGDFYYLTQDAWTGTADAFNDPGIRAKTTISSAELTELIKGVAALKQVLIIDACGSGKAVENLMAKRDISSSTLRALDRMKDRTGLHIITGCAADAVSYEASKYGQGVLTYSLLEGIRGASLREEKFVDVLKLFQYCAERVPLIAGGIGGIQQPQIFSPYGESGFDIGEILSADKSLIPLSLAKPMFLMCSLKDKDSFDDILGIEKLVDEQLRDVSAKGADAPIIFIEAKEYPDAYRIRGAYGITGNQVEITVNLFLGSEKAGNFSVKGKKTEISILAEEIVKKAMEIY